jgi:hypothetical protein
MEELSRVDKCYLYYDLMQSFVFQAEYAWTNLLFARYINPCPLVFCIKNLFQIIPAAGIAYILLILLLGSGILSVLCEPATHVWKFSDSSMELNIGIRVRHGGSRAGHRDGKHTGCDFYTDIPRSLRYPQTPSPLICQ